jgi:hypothetical protein
LTGNNKGSDKGDDTNSEDNRIAIESNPGNNNHDKNNENNSGPERWILFLGIGILMVGVVLLALRSVLFSLILIVAGVSVFTYWLYANASANARPSNRMANIITDTEKQDEDCLCSICGHRVSGTCFQNRCACCLLMKDDKVIGHSNNSLQ